MKIRFSNEEKKYITVAELPIVRQIIADFKEDSGLMEYAEMAVNCAAGECGNNCKKIYEATAKIAKNCRAWNDLSEDSGDLDVWIEVSALTYDGRFYIIGAYITDIWQIGGVEKSEIRRHMYIRKFEEVK